MNDVVRLPKYMAMISRLSSQYINITLSDYEINYTQFIILMTLYREEGIIQDKLVDVLYIDKGAVTRAIKDLVDKGYVLRKTDNLDKRAKKIYITKKAVDIKNDLINNANNWNLHLTKGIGDEEKVLLIKQLDIMFNNSKEVVKSIKY